MIIDIPISRQREAARVVVRRSPGLVPTMLRLSYDGHRRRDAARACSSVWGRCGKQTTQPSSISLATCWHARVSQLPCADAFIAWLYCGGFAKSAQLKISRLGERARARFLDVKNQGKTVLLKKNFRLRRAKAVFPDIGCISDTFSFFDTITL